MRCLLPEDMDGFSQYGRILLETWTYSGRWKGDQIACETLRRPAGGNGHHSVQQRVDSGWVTARLSQADGLPGYDAHESPPPPLPPSPPNSTRASFPLILFLWRPMSLFMIFSSSLSLQCVCSETPVVVKLPWLSLKPRPNEIWMCREWIRVMERAKYCLRGVLAILSWGDRYSGPRKVKTPSPSSAHLSAGQRSLSSCSLGDSASEFCFRCERRGGSRMTGNTSHLLRWWCLDFKNTIWLRQLLSFLIRFKNSLFL